MSCSPTMTSASFLPLTRSHCWVTSWMASVAWVCVSWQQDPDVVLKKQNCLLRNVSLPQQYHPAVACLQSLLSDCPGQLHIPFGPTGNNISISSLKPFTFTFVCMCMCVWWMHMHVCVLVHVCECRYTCDTVCTRKSEDNYRSQSLPSILFETRSPSCSLLGK